MPPSHGAYLPSGIRISGRGAERILEQATAEAARLKPGPRGETLYALQCTMDPAVRGRTAVERILDAVTDEIRRTWSECPRLTRDEAVERIPSRFGGLSYRIEATPGKEWLGEILWRAVHPQVAGASLTTWVLVEERPSYTRLNVRVTADQGTFSVRGYVGAGQAQPAFLEALRGDVPLVWMGTHVAAHAIRPGQTADFVASVMEDPDRVLPVAVLSPTEDGEYVVDPEELAWELLGRARLHVLQTHPQTFELTDAIGDRRMSAYWGAVHAYWPGWSPHDDPMDHPLLVADRLADPVMRAAWLGELGMWLGSRIELSPSFDERREPAAEEEGDATADAVAEAESPGAAPAEAAPVEAPGAAAPPSWPDPTPLIHRLLAEMESVAELVNRLTDEVERLRTIGAVRSSSTAAIERRLGRLEDLLEGAFAGADAEGRAAAAEAPAAPAGPDAGEADEGAATLAEIVQDAAETHADVLLFLASAHQSARESPYEDPERVRAILDAMARVARLRRDGALGTGLREAFRDLGVDYRPNIGKSTSGRLREQYRFVDDGGRPLEAVEHIALGGTYDPRRCLRIYFSSRVASESRFVIAHVGRHFDVMTTS